MKQFLILALPMLMISSAAGGQTAETAGRTIDINSLLQIDPDIRQVTHYMHGLGASGSVKVVVQINCAARQHKLLSMSDAAGEAPIFDDEPWMSIGGALEDRQLFLTVCGEEASRRLQAAAGPEYPATALREGKEGTAGYRITIAPTGEITNCEIIETSGHADLDAATCDYAKRTLQSAGSGERYYENRVRWQLPK